MLLQIASLVVDFVGGFFVLMFLLRFYFQWLRVPFRNQLGDFVVATTRWMVNPARRVVPPLRGLDLASFACALIMQALVIGLKYAIAGFDFATAPGTFVGRIFFEGFIELLIASVRILIFSVVLQAVLSWVNPDNPLQYVLDAFTRPMLRPIRRFLPPVANVDLSPLVLILALLILLVPLAELRGLAAGLF